MELIPSRRCPMMDWHKHAEFQFRMSCGFCMTSADVWGLGSASEDMYESQQRQPRGDDSFSRVEITETNLDYHYLPLNLKRNRQLRILVLRPGKFEDDLHCDLELANLQKGPLYDAISYTWADQTGNDTSSQKISCGPKGKIIHVTKNCEAALRRMRKVDTERRLWIDSICINQSNFRERNHQVRNMIATFRSAQRVLIYLGEGDTKIHRLLEYMSMDQAGTLPDSSDFLLLFQSRWFHRVWVLQEIAVAKELLLICGPLTVTWKDFMIYVKLFQRMVSESVRRIFLPPVLNYGIQTLELKATQSTAKFDLLSMLQVSRSCACKDPRDKIYAVMGLVQEDSTPPIPIDYSPRILVGSVYLQAAAWHITKTGSLRVLSHVHGESKLDMPSWVPDWTLRGLKMLPPAVFQSSSINLAPEVLSNEDTTPPARQKKLRVTGRRLGNVWPAETIFQTSETKKPKDEPKAEPGPEPEPKPKHRWRRILSKLMQPSVPAVRALGNTRRKAILQYPSGHHDTQHHRESYASNLQIYLEDQPHHWLFKPSPVIGNRLCVGRQSFWDDVIPLAKKPHQTDSQKPRDRTPLLDIPAAFGAFCENCRRLDSMFWQTLKNAYPALQTDTPEGFGFGVRQQHLACMCLTYNAKRNIRETEYSKAMRSRPNSTVQPLPTYWHYCEEEVSSFQQHFREYGHGRRLFGTEYSLGFGPENIEEGDEVWQLGGADVLMVLRSDPTKPDGNYKVVGECHLHAAERRYDCCILCDAKMERRPVPSLSRGRTDSGWVFETTAGIRKEEENLNLGDGSSQVIYIW